MGGPGSGWQGAKRATVEQGLILSIKDLARVGALNPGWRDGSLCWHYRGQDETIAAIGYHSIIRADGTKAVPDRFESEGFPRGYEWRSLGALILPFGG
jgi:hypothetical protein